MKKADAVVFIPFGNIARKYGYITWRKRQDNEIKDFLGKKKFINLHYDNDVLNNKNIDWNRRRIPITYTVTRSVPQSAKMIKIQRFKGNKYRLSFE